jgi:hypothetical protein
MIHNLIHNPDSVKINGAVGDQEFGDGHPILDVVRNAARS